MGTFWSPFIPVHPHVRSLKSGGVPKKVSEVPRLFLETFLSVLAIEFMVLVNTPRLIHCLMIYCGKNIWLEINKCCVMITCCWVDPIPFDFPNWIVSGLVVGVDNRKKCPLDLKSYLFNSYKEIIFCGRCILFT